MKKLKACFNRGAWLGIMALWMGCASRQVQMPPSYPPESTLLDEKVRRILSLDQELRRYAIKVNSFQGSVMLDGTVDSEAQRQQAARLTWGVQGVRGVENNLLLKSGTGQ